MSTSTLTRPTSVPRDRTERTPARVGTYTGAPSAVGTYTGTGTGAVVGTYTGTSAATGSYVRSER